VLNPRASVSPSKQPAVETLDEVRRSILAQLPATLFESVRRWSLSTPEHLAVVDSSESLTYRELDLAVERTAKWLVDSEIRPGDRVMIVFENCKAFVVLFFALTEIRAWPVPLNARLSEREIDTIRQHCGARRILYTAEASSLAMGHAKRDRATFENVADIGTIGMGVNRETSPEPAERDPANAVGALIYTSGTTGNPKGVMLTHRNLLFAAFTAAQVRLITPTDRILGVLPMSHVTGLSVQFLGTLVSGAAFFLLPRFDPMKVRAAIEQYRITVLYGVPFLYTQFLEYAKLRELNSLRFSDLRLMNSAAAPLLPAVRVAVEELFGLPLQNGYGVSECSPVISVTRIGAPRNGASAGPIYPGVEVKIVGADEKEVADGEVGEVRVRGPNVMKGYYHAAAETEKVLDSAGWFNTQDLARMENGELFVVGRTKELIIRFGFNVYPVEVESVLNSFQEVALSAVVGRTNEKTGEQDIIAFVKLESGSLTTSENLAKYLAENLAPYKRPTEIRFVSELPMTASGKVMKDKLVNGLNNETASH
jgi:long-chain acyl-CoA synthetase